jgi:hypothetical protein
MGNLLVIDEVYHIKNKGTIYLSFYTYINFDDIYKAGQGIDAKGNWTITWTSYDPQTHYTTEITYEGDFEDEPGEVFSIYNTSLGFNYIIDLTYLVFEVKNPGELKLHYELDLSSEIHIIPTLDVLIISKISWFPSWIEYFTVAVTILSLFLSWEKERLKKTTDNSKEERM